MRLFRLDGRKLIANYVDCLAARLAIARAVGWPRQTRLIWANPSFFKHFNGAPSTIGRRRPRTDARNFDSSAGPLAQ